MPIPLAFVTRFFQLVTRRRFAEAERILERLKGKVSKTEWNTGYFQALYGILLARRSNDPYVFLSNLDFGDKDKLRNYRRDFLKHARNRLHSDYDRGFFSAWADYMRILSKMDLNAAKTSPKKAVSG
jgi:hypothetical protein